MHSESGLSPRVRGNPPVRLSARLSGRSIPACAGEPRIGYTADEAWEVYPRVCGGTSPALDAGTGRRGLSPRVRGNQAQAEIESRVRGLSPRVRGNRPGVPQRGGWPGSIPACAGEPAWCSATGRVARVYPRVCGGTAQGAEPPRPPAGLSPRVRGNRHALAPFALVGGSIPACAGEPGTRVDDLGYSRVYPRVCGGTRDRSRGCPNRTGLSPRVRGNRVPRAAEPDSARSIPACAGEPSGVRERCCVDRVYPRVCGGTTETETSPRCVRGLSPRVRGNRRGRGRGAGREGSIPACAGEPRSASRCRSRRRVYPRVCGGTATRPGQRVTVTGLSPRVRGNHHRALALHGALGSIPACAGEPPAVWGAGMRLTGLSPRVRGNP